MNLIEGVGWQSVRKLSGECVDAPFLLVRKTFVQALCKKDEAKFKRLRGTQRKPAQHSGKCTSMVSWGHRFDYGSGLQKTFKGVVFKWENK